MYQGELKGSSSESKVVAVFGATGRELNETIVG
jgi:hypothetical protein